MKKTLFTYFVTIVLFLSFGKINAQTNIVGNPIKVGNIEVAQHNYSSQNWEDAKIFCYNLGNNWRLPTEEELTVLFINKDKIEDISTLISYWTSTDYGDSLHAISGYFNGNNPSFSITEKKYGMLVRAVRTINNNNSITSSVNTNKNGSDNKSYSTISLSDNQSSSKQNSTNQNCNVTFQIPSLPFKFIDNRKLCVYCNSRYVPYTKVSNFNINETKTSMIIDFILSQIDKHCESVGADNNHKATHIEQIANLLIKKGLLNSMEDIAAPVVSHYETSKYINGISDVLGNMSALLGLPKEKKQNSEYSINLYENDNTKFCSREHEDRYLKRY